jgi:hypothetical protein
MTVIFVASIAHVWCRIELEVFRALGHGQRSVDPGCIKVANKANQCGL